MVDESPFEPVADIIAASGHIGYRWDLLSDHIEWLGPWQQLFGKERDIPPVNARELSACILANDHYLVFNEMPVAFDREYRFRTDKGVLIWVQEHGTTDYENGRAVRQQGLLRLIEKKPEPPRHYASPDRDALTGRPNRACLLSALDKLLNGPHINRQNSAYLVVGIDNLAFVNDAMGTKAADQLICSVADRLNDICPTRALIGRVGGDMFGILLPQMAKDMETLAERILVNFHDHALSAGPTYIHLSVCIGCLPLADTSYDASEAMVHAEQALHEAHLAGRGQKVTYIESSRRAEQNRAILHIYERVKRALKARALCLAYQPIVDAQSGEVVFYEALARLFNDDGSVMPAGEFIPVVEQMGLSPEFDHYVLDLAIEELETSPSLSLAINISGLTAALPDWPGHIQDRLAGRPHVAKRLIVEITETAAVQDIEKIKILVQTLRHVGCQVSLDDFGAGSTSIRHLRELEFAIMKIDRDLLINVTTSEEQQHLVRTLIAMAHGLGMKSVAEGIENEETAAWLRQERADYLQGYHLGRPSFDRPWKGEFNVTSAAAHEQRVPAQHQDKSSPNAFI